MNDLKFAIGMEIDGEKYYREQAEINKNNSLRTVCLMLAEEEKKHAQILRDKMSELPSIFTDSDILSKAKSIFRGIADIKMEWKEKPSQLDFYRIATAKEKQSIDLYSEFLLKADGDQEKELLEYLIKQEEQHFAILDELASMLRHAEEWIESAEFGVRKEY